MPTLVTLALRIALPRQASLQPRTMPGPERYCRDLKACRGQEQAQGRGWPLEGMPCPHGALALQVLLNPDLPRCHWA